MNNSEESGTPPLLPKFPEKTVYIFNMSEDVWPFIGAMSDAAAKAAEIKENADLTDRDLFSCADEANIVFVFTQPVDASFLSYYERLFGKKNIDIIVPKKHSGVICRDILEDETALSSIIEAANGSRRLALTSYTTSQQFLELVAVLRKRGLAVATPDAPEEEDSWTVNFFGSKSGIRQLAQQSRAAEPDFMMPDGVIASGVVDAAKIAAKKYVKERGVVLKTNKGHSGAGLLIFRAGELPDEYTACEQKILGELRKDAYWDMFPIVIESYISVNPAVGGGFPNVEFRILKNGHVEFLYYCGMRVDRAGVFKGVEIHNEVVSDQVGARMVDTGFFIGEQYRAAGYRGYFDVDFAAAKNGHLYVTESNVRRTGGTHVYITAERLFGKDFMYLTYILSHNSYELPATKHYTFRDIELRLSPVMFNKKTKEGVIIASANQLAQHKLAYIVFGENKKRAYELEAKMEELLV